MRRALSGTACGERWTGREARPRNHRPAGRLNPPVDRRREGFAGVAGDLFSSGEPVLVAVADVPRRREGLEAIVAGLAPGGMPVASWERRRGRSRSGRRRSAISSHSIRPRAARSTRCCAQARRSHLAWGPREADFALLVWRSELDLRPALVDVFRALRAVARGAPPDELERALSGGGRYPRSPELCARLLRVLSELRLVELSLRPPACRMLPGARAELELSPTYRASRERLRAIERALAPELAPAARDPAARAA